MSCVGWASLSLPHSITKPLSFHTFIIPFSNNNIQLLCLCECSNEWNNNHIINTFQNKRKRSNSHRIVTQVKITLPPKAVFQTDNVKTYSFPFPTLQNLQNTNSKYRLTRTLCMFRMWIWTFNKHNKSFMTTTTTRMIFKMLHLLLYISLSSNIMNIHKLEIFIWISDFCFPTLFRLWRDCWFLVKWNSTNKSELNKTCCVLLTINPTYLELL